MAKVDNRNRSNFIANEMQKLADAEKAKNSEVANG